jgi:hypothetical protein
MKDDPVKENNRRYAWLVLGMFFLSGAMSCATNPDIYTDIDQNVEENRFNEGVDVLVEKQNQKKPMYPEKNAVLLYLDKGMLEHYAGQYENSAKDLENAEALIREAFTKSVSLEIASYIANDNTREYAGEDYEDVYLNAFNALNYYYRGDLEEALVEVRKINEKLRYLETKYAEDIAKAREYGKEHGGEDLSYDADEGPAFSDSALARYLSALFYRGTGRPDDARIDLEGLVKAFEAAPAVYKHPVPNSVADEYSVPSGKARLNVIGFAGLSPVKSEIITLVPLPFPSPNDVAKLALPVISDRPVKADRVELVIDGKDKIDLELLEDIGAVISETFKARRILIYIKTLVRTVIKTTAAASGAQVAGEQSGSAIVGVLTGILGQAISAASESADIRMSRYFPCYAYVGGVNLDPGEHHIAVNFYAGGSLIFSKQETIDADARGLNLVEAFCLQ